MSKLNRVRKLTTNIDDIKGYFVQGKIAEWLMNDNAPARAVWELTPLELSWMLGITKETAKRWFKDNKIETEYSEFHKTNVTNNKALGKFLLDNPKYELILAARVTSPIEAKVDFWPGHDDYNFEKILDWLIQAELSIKENLYEDIGAWNHYWFNKYDVIEQYLLNFGFEEVIEV